jgi:Ca-activated chloride channel family protein
MRKMAELGRGLCEFIADTREADNRVATFFERLDRPVMTDIEWQTEGLRIDDTYPRRLTDLHSGQPLYLSARIDGTQKSGRLSLGGYSRDGWLSTGVAINESAQEGNGVAVRWARAKVGSLMDSLHEGADPGAVRGEVVEIGLEFNLVTAYTSLVAVDDRPTALGASRLTRVATALPQGGTEGPLRRSLGVVLLAVGLLMLLLLKLVRTR